MTMVFWAVDGDGRSIVFGGIFIIIAGDREKAGNSKGGKGLRRSMSIYTDDGQKYGVMYGLFVSGC